MFKFIPSTMPGRIYVVGCGGTGSRVVPLLAQFIRSITREFSPRGWLNNTQIVLIDGDVVEQKNLLRQNFISQDVGKNKAAVLAARYGKAYGVNIVAYPEFIKKLPDPRAFRRSIPGYEDSVQCDEMVVMCVDSAAARRLVLDVFAPRNNQQRNVYIDAGNEDSFGQVRYFTSDIITHSMSVPELKAIRNPERLEIEESINYIPYDVNFYEDMQDNPGLGSCADLDQTLAINAIMATLIIGIIQNYYYAKPMTYNEVSIDLQGSCSFTYNTVSNFRNKAVEGIKYKAIGQGPRSGLIGGSEYKTMSDLWAFIIKNQTAVQKILKAQEKLAEQAEAKGKVETNKETIEERKAKVGKKTTSQLAALRQAEVDVLATSTSPAIQSIDNLLADAVGDRDYHGHDEL